MALSTFGRTSRDLKLRVFSVLFSLHMFSYFCRWIGGIGWSLRRRRHLHRWWRWKRWWPRNILTGHPHEPTEAVEMNWRTDFAHFLTNCFYFISYWIRLVLCSALFWVKIIKSASWMSGKCCFVCQRLQRKESDERAGRFINTALFCCDFRLICILQIGITQYSIISSQKKLQI